jgi:hypothetical protein
VGVVERVALAVDHPDRYAFERYSIAIGANSRFRLSGDERVFDYARAAVARLEAELPSDSARNRGRVG